MDGPCGMSCTEQLWGMAPTLQAPWTDTQLREDLRRSERYQMELEAKNIELNRELGVFLLQMHIAREDLERARAEKRELEARLEAASTQARELQELRMELALLRSEREERLEQEQLAVEIWGPANRRQPDATWDPPPVLLFSQGQPVEALSDPGVLLFSQGGPAEALSDPAILLFARRGEKDRPLTVGKVAADLGFKCSAQSLHRLGSHVRDAFMRAHGRVPEPRVFYDRPGVADKIGCFTERDRELIAAVVRAHGEPDVD